MGKQPMDSLSLVPLPDRSSEGVGAEDGGSEGGGAVSLRPGPCSKLFGRTVGDAQEKVPVFDAGTSASHDAPRYQRIDQVFMRTTYTVSL